MSSLTTGDWFSLGVFIGVGIFAFKSMYEEYKIFNQPFQNSRDIYKEDRLKRADALNIDKHPFFKSKDLVETSKKFREQYSFIFQISFSKKCNKKTKDWGEGKLCNQLKNFFALAMDPKQPCMITVLEFRKLEHCWDFQLYVYGENEYLATKKYAQKHDNVFDIGYGVMMELESDDPYSYHSSIGAKMCQEILNDKTEEIK